MQMESRARVDWDVLESFKVFAGTQRRAAAEARAKALMDEKNKKKKAAELKEFAAKFKLSTPVPIDLFTLVDVPKEGTV